MKEHFLASKSSGFKLPFIKMFLHSWATSATQEKKKIILTGNEESNNVCLQWAGPAICWFMRVPWWWSRHDCILITSIYFIWHPMDMNQGVIVSFVVLVLLKHVHCLKMKCCCLIQCVWDALCSSFITWIWHHVLDMHFIDLSTLRLVFCLDKNSNRSYLYMISLF